MPAWRITCALLTVLSTVSCMPGSGGVSPPDDRFFYPTAAALTPDGDYLAVANSNFDLAYSHGTVVLVDLSAVEDELTSGCPAAGCEPVEERDYILREETVRVGSYASHFARADDGGRMYLTVRGDTSLTWMTVAPGAGAGRRLTCFDPESPPSSRKCDSDHTVSSGLPSDPSSVSVHRRTYELVDDEGEPAGETTVDWIFVTHLTSGNVSVLQTEAAVDPDRGLAPRLVLVDEVLPLGVSAIRAHPLAEDLFYASTRHSTSLHTFGFASDPRDFDNATRIVLGRTVNLAAVITDGYDSRDMAFSPDGRRLYLANRSPNSLLTIDVSPDQWGWPRNDIVGVAELDVGPSLVSVWKPEGWDTEWVYVTCFNSDRVYVIDPVLRRPVDVILTGNGPHVFVTDPARGRGYLVNFIESTVSVVDLDPASTTFNEVRATLGIPEKVRSND
jgi:DNA-binding beta-propeller fold protein YncE